MSDYAKLHTDALDNNKIQSLPEDLIRPWINCILISRLAGGMLPDLTVVAFRMRVSQAQALDWLTRLEERGLIDQVGSERQMHDWEDWNPPLPVDRTNAERQRRYRQRRGNAPSPAPLTPKQENEYNELHQGVTPLRNDTVTPLRNGVSNGVTAKAVVADEDWPKSMAAITDRFPTADAPFCRRIIEAGVRAHIGAARNGTKLTDLILSRCVETATVKGQQSPALYLKTLATVVKNQVETHERKKK